MKNSYAPTGGNIGFTLTELLVVIAVIVVLAAMLIPIIGMIRRSADRVVCSSALRQIGMAGLAYPNENEGQLAPVVWQFADGTSISWETCLQEKLSQDEASLGHDNVKGDAKYHSILQGCPTFMHEMVVNPNPLAGATGKQLAWGNASYGYTVSPLYDLKASGGVIDTNAQSGHMYYPSLGWGVPIPTFIELSHVTHPTKRAMAGDAYQYFLPYYEPRRNESIDCTDSSQAPGTDTSRSVGSPFRHGNGYNLVYFDGHVGFYKAEPLCLPIFSPSEAQ